MNAKQTRRFKSAMTWGIWILLTVGLITYFSLKLFNNDQPDEVFLVGDITSGHHQIGVSCTACHTDSFGGDDIIQGACMNCHGAELEASHDSHPKSKFTDPRNANRIEIIDARECVSCHTEHQPEIAGVMGLTLPEDFCMECHSDIGDNRESHKGMGFDTCSSAGCHNYHDNRALYEEFLLKEANSDLAIKNLELPEHILKDDPRLPIRQVMEHPEKVLTRKDANAPEKYLGDISVVHLWETTSHAKQGVNCIDCHKSSDKVSQTASTTWVSKPDFKICMDCHKKEGEGFVLGKHGMRIAQGLEPMKVKDAKVSLKFSAMQKELTCTSCHNDHSFNTDFAAVEACLGCHNDEHSLNYSESKHAKHWRAEQRGEAPQGSGVSCASCHLPRMDHKDPEKIFALHNQNDTLRPNEKMIRPVCIECHTLEFSIDALADKELIKNNFQGRPGNHIESIDMALDRVK